MHHHPMNLFAAFKMNGWCFYRIVRFPVTDIFLFFVKKLLIYWLQLRGFQAVQWKKCFRKRSPPRPLKLWITAGSLEVKGGWTAMHQSLSSEHVPPLARARTNQEFSRVTGKKVCPYLFTGQAVNMSTAEKATDWGVLPSWYLAECKHNLIKK